jgi:Fe-S cluster assembly protein SufD
MANQPVIIRKKRSDRSQPKEFTFSSEMIPALSPEWEGPDFISEYRSTAWDAYKSQSFPKTTDEPWRRTDLRNLKVGDFRVAVNGDASSLPTPPENVFQSLAGDQFGGQLLLSPDNSTIHVDPTLIEMGVVFTDLLTAEREYPEILKRVIGKIVQPDEGKFASLAAAMSQNGVLLYIPRGVHLDQPLQSYYWGPGGGLAHFTHVLIFLEENSSVTYSHEAASPTETNGQTLHAGLVEIFVGEGAELRFVELQSWGEHVWNFSHERAIVERNANIDWVFGAVGSHLTKNFTDLNLVGEGSTGRMSGFYFTEGDQHLDHDTQQNHMAPHTTSDLLFKGALKDSSRSVWQGMIYVAPGAQGTDGYQANRNLVLSRKARADSIPGLEILADDVRCTHGATVGKIDPEPIFYLQSRGIPYEDAERLIVEGFFDPIMQRIPFDGVRSRFKQVIIEKLDK